MMKLLLSGLVFSIFVFCIVSFSPKATAYTSGISATSVTGQANFTSLQANQGGAVSSQTISSPSAVLVVGSQLLIADSVNNRVLIYNNIPTNNNQAADVVLGQPDMTTSSSGCTQSKLNLGDGGVFFVNGKLFIADRNNNRVLIYNSIPTSNGANANLVIGQSSFTTCSQNAGGTPSAKTLSGPTDITSDGAKLYISDSNNNRVLGYMSIPSTSNPTADIVLGQPDFTTVTPNTAGLGNDVFNTPRGLAMYKGKLLVADTNNYRVVIFNATPITTNDFADVEIGQPDFVSNSKLAVSSQTLQPLRLTVDTSGILYVGDALGNRVLIYNSIPSVNNTQANLVIGQQTFTSSSANAGGIGPATLSSPKAAFSTYNQLIVADSVNNRILIYPNTTQTPSINVSNNTPGNPDGTITVNGTASVSSPYTISTVQYSANGDGWTDATAVNGAFTTTSEPFTVTFDPAANENQTVGYTLRIRAIDSNGDISPYAFFFSPFTTNAPEDNSVVTTPYPTFDFSVNTQRSFIKDNVQRYQIWLRKSGTSTWKLYLDNIPSDFAAVKGNSDNIKRSMYLNTQTNNGTYENTNLSVTFAEESSHILVYAKEQTPTSFDQGGKSLAGAYAWKVTAVDKAGHALESDWRYLRVNAHQTTDQQQFFPLTILSITGINNPNISSLHTDQIQQSYTTNSSGPTIYGIAAWQSLITVTLTDSTCSAVDETQCTQSYTATTNESSRFGINIPPGSLTPNVDYTVNISASLNEDYIELPDFSLTYSNMQKAQFEAKVMQKPFISQTPQDIIDKYVFPYGNKPESLLTTLFPLLFSH